MPSYCLVTTSLEETWDPEHPNLFLGEWARRYARRAAWSVPGNAVCEPLVPHAQERLRQFEALQAFAGELLPQLAAALDGLHGTRHGRRYWNMLLGHWLQRYLSCLFNRVETLRQAVERHPVSHTRVLDADGVHLSTRDTGAFVAAANDPLWDHVLCARILADLTDVQARPCGEARVAQGARPAAGAGWKAVARRAVDRASTALTRPGDALILNSYLPARQEALLALSLGQAPKKWMPRGLPDWTPDPSLRARLSQQLGTGGDGFQALARRYLADLLPRCFLEGYAQLRTMAQALPWPSRPRFVFTSNNFDSDELFKCWTAEKAAAGAPYIVGQHGAGYGTHLFFQTPYGPELRDSDRFVTWGWSDAATRAVPAFVLKTAGVPRHTRRPVPQAGRLLLVAPVLPNRITHWDSIHEFALNQEMQFRFVEALPEAIRQQVVVRLHHGAAGKPWDDVARWADRAPGVPVDDGRVPLERQLGQVKLPLFAYDSTGLLEFLSLDRPAAALWHGGLDHLTPQARRDYEPLVDAGIVHLDADAAARWVADHWADLRGWWDRPDVARARRDFGERYARRCDRPVATLRRLLLDAAPAVA